MKLEKIRFFPTCKTTVAPYRYEAFIGIGGNEGNVKKRFVALYRLLQDDPRIFVQKSSSVFQNPPFGYANQNDFYNAVMVIRTSLHVNALLKILLHVENKFRRIRLFENGPRTLDLDIIFFNNYKRHQKHVIVPHPKWQERLSVRVPLLVLKRFKG
ncbi:2-amino-4-hydroxy-6-hydroxymethyldihydropteridine diphosphokinase [Sulfurospirillum barnesii]|uniref:2-amino-4-hydroxy-6-hydroxymethyldihydropteridine pyrophosphokinase n=1 Tax=Sulfurospirillum barnesii (strain ATCC 700032 / DSM 10660 / SES-3) TaxID=760154 RepID=I3XUL4_SULBS|nr:2-amino-4-hydroxy-6-hydroxymethyldihydropteridine diphosphokinase [Sulfurospirillum barnesii]AFL67638.1 2-amino-4-hydroxy-6-hydroxymethyldihydropteridine pyrophosphokinase [Sulfurospirillum barnesii SES-3]